MRLLIRRVLTGRAVLIAALGLSLLHSVPAAAQYDAIIRGVLGGILGAGQNGAVPGRGPFWAPAPNRGFQTPALNVAGGPSYDCRRASIAATRTICGSEELSRLDRVMADAFVAALSAGGDTRVLHAAQTAWLVKRNACGANFSCLQQAMTLRTAELQGGRIFGTDTGFATNPAGSDRGFPSATVPAADVQRDTSSDEALLRLMHPPAGVAPWAFETFEGHPAITYLYERRPGASMRDAEAANFFFTMLAIGRDPDLVDSMAGAYPDPKLLSLVEPSAAQPYIDASAWKGNNQLTQETSRDGFLTKFRPLLTEAAPQSPLRITWIEKARLGPYDAKTKGFPVKTSGREIGSVNVLRTGLALSEAVSAGGLGVAQPFAVPIMFFPINRSAAEALLSQTPGGEVELVADVTIAGFENGRNLRLQLNRLDLYKAGHRDKLYSFPVGRSPIGPLDLAGDGAGGSGGASEAAAIAYWGLPVLNGLPLFSTQYSDILDSARQGAQGPSYPEHWSRMLHAMGLAMNPDPAKISDGDATALACMFLTDVQRVQMFSQDACSFSLSSPGAVFQQKDGAAVFRRNVLASIVARAPRLPFAMKIVLPADLQPYDMKARQFPLGLRETGNRIAIFNSPLDVLLPTALPATEAEGRRFAEATGKYGRAWLALDVAIVGATPPSAPSGLMSGASGLPDHRTWIFKTQRMGIFADAQLTSLMRDYDLNEFRTAPLSAAASPASTADAARSDGELALLAVLAQAPDPPMPIDWTRAALQRFSFEDTWRSRVDWREIDPWGVFFTSEPDPSSVERYRKWTQERARNLPHHVYLRTLLAPYLATNRPPTLPLLQNGRYTVGGPNDTQITSAMPGDELLRRMRAHGVDKTQIVNMPTLMAGNDRIPVYAAVPAPVADYVLDLSASPPNLDPQGPQPTLNVIAELSSAEVYRYGEGESAMAVLLKLKPLSASLEQGGKRVARYDLPDRQWGAPPAALPSAEQRLSGGAYGPEVLGIKLGMPMKEAEALVRGRLDHLRVLETDSLYDQQQRGPTHGVLFMDTVTQEQIALFDWPPLAKDRVVQMWRTMPSPREAWPKILSEVLTPKYGSPLATGDHEAAWTPAPPAERTTGNCLEGSGFGPWRWKEDGGPPLSTLAAEAPEAPQIREDFERCL